MNEDHEIMSQMPPETGPDRKLLTQWLRYLMYLIAAGLALRLLRMVPVLSGVVTWLNYAVSVMSIVVLFRLSGQCDRYRKAAVLCCVVFLGGLLNQLLPILFRGAAAANLLASLITLALSVCSIVASYQEVYGHADMVRDLSAKLSGKWRSLFTWQLVIGIAAGLLSGFVSIITVAVGGSAAPVASLVALAVTGINLVLSILYLVYMKRMLGLLEEAPGQDMKACDPPVDL